MNLTNHEINVLRNCKDLGRYVQNISKVLSDENQTHEGRIFIHDLKEYIKLKEKENLSVENKKVKLALKEKIIDFLNKH